MTDEPKPDDWADEIAQKVQIELNTYHAALVREGQALKALQGPNPLAQALRNAEEQGYKRGYDAGYKCADEGRL